MGQPPVTVEHGGLTITTNTATEADLRAELARDTPSGDAPPTEAPAVPPAPPDGTPAPPARDAQGRFVKQAADAPAEPSAAPVEPSEPPVEPPQRRKDDTPRHHPIARMNQALAQKAESDRRLAALEAELARLRQPAAPAPVPATPPASTNGHGDAEPQFEQFADQPDPYTAYMHAWARWDNRRQIAETIAGLEERQAAKTREQTFTTNLAEGRKAYADFDQRLTEADTLGLQVSAVMREAITTSPKAADLVYFLATHPEECTQLALETEHTPPLAAATVVQRLLESYLAPRAVSRHGNGAAAAAPTSTAKPPIQPVGSSPVVSDDPPGESASAAEHARYWNRRLKVPGALK